VFLKSDFGSTCIAATAGLRREAGVTISDCADHVAVHESAIADMSSATINSASESKAYIASASQNVL
jgi:hypothetical protein